MFGDGVSAEQGTFSSIPTGKNFPSSGPQTRQSPRRSPFTDQIDVPRTSLVLISINTYQNNVLSVNTYHINDINHFETYFFIFFHYTSIFS
ncbi:hypothetical protein QL285_087896 [Trifolium repens]|nr:hypothetical protein QL285_087896 [Trifolium repens]